MRIEIYSQFFLFLLSIISENYLIKHNSLNQCVITFIRKGLSIFSMIINKISSIGELKGDIFSNSSEIVKEVIA